METSAAARADALAAEEARAEQLARRLAALGERLGAQALTAEFDFGARLARLEATMLALRVGAVDDALDASCGALSRAVLEKRG
ncbi:MAG: hypothetical protein QGH07_17205, partial [Alphaproteobacteria bacterium]|nr:hypothetical protein [Alphaproteobacteria bacterium]